MSRPEQLPLDLPHRPARGMEDFLVADCNRAAVAWIDRWPQWPAPLVVICGPEACGKSHLVHVWQARSGGSIIDAAELERFDPGAVMGKFALAIEDAGPGLSAAGQRNFFHLYNIAGENGGSLLATSRLPPGQWKIAIPDLASRLAGAPLAAIGAPDDALLAAVIVKLLADRQLKVGAEIVSYLVPRIERSFGAVRRIVAAIDATALAQGRNVTVALVRDVLERTVPDRDGDA